MGRGIDPAKNRKRHGPYPDVQLNPATVSAVFEFGKPTPG
jgi:hypothetical protein